MRQDRCELVGGGTWSRARVLVNVSVFMSIYERAFMSVQMRDVVGRTWSASRHELTRVHRDVKSIRFFWRSFWSLELLGTGWSCGSEEQSRQVTDSLLRASERFFIVH